MLQVYVTRGIQGGESRREMLIHRFLECASLHEQIQLRRWGQLSASAFCFVHDEEGDLDKERVRKLQSKGIRMVGSKWMERCIVENRVVGLEEEIASTPTLKKSLFATMGSRGDEQIVKRAKSTIPPWTRAEDDVLRMVKRLREKGEEKKAKQFRMLLLDRGREEQHILARENMVCSWIDEDEFLTE